jgi:hypothetical protein
MKPYDLFFIFSAMRNIDGCLHYLVCSSVFLGFFNPFLFNILIIIASKYFAELTLLVMPVLLARPNNVVAPHALARQHLPH